MNNFEKYSVLMSVYLKENPQYLRSSIDSMLSQTVKPDEIVIVEDGPLTDALYSVLDDYKKRFPDIIVIESLKNNMGLGAALNFGLNKCQNELIARMDTDDISLPNRCEKQLIAFAQNKQLSIVGTQIKEFVGTTDNIVSARIVPINYDEILKFSRRRSPFNHPTVMYKKSVILSIGGYKAYGRKEDLELFIRLVHKEYAINLPDKLLLYRTNPDNLKRRTTWINCSEYIKIMFNFYKQGYLGVSDIIYVILGQLTMYIMPKNIVSWLSLKLLRSSK